MERGEILKQLRSWENEGVLFSQKSSGIKNYKLYGMIVRGQCYKLDKSFLYSHTKNVRDKFNKLFEAGEILSADSALERFPEFGSRPKFDRACAEGFALKVHICGVLLYIRGGDDDRI